MILVEAVDRPRSCRTRNSNKPPSVIKNPASSATISAGLKLISDVVIAMPARMKIAFAMTKSKARNYDAGNRRFQRNMRSEQKNFGRFAAHRGNRNSLIERGSPPGGQGISGRIVRACDVEGE